jgi:hypothetical protein
MPSMVADECALSEEELFTGSLARMSNEKPQWEAFGSSPRLEEDRTVSVRVST